MSGKPEPDPLGKATTLLSKSSNNNSLIKSWERLILQGPGQSLGSSTTSVVPTGSKSSSVAPLAPLARPQVRVHRRGPPRPLGNLGIAAQKLRETTQQTPVLKSTPAPQSAAVSENDFKFNSGSSALGSGSKESGVAWENPYDVTGRIKIPILGREDSILSANSIEHVGISSIEGPRPNMKSLKKSASGKKSASSVEDDNSSDDEEKETENESESLNNIFIDLTRDLRELSTISTTPNAIPYPNPEPLILIPVDEINSVVKKLVKTKVITTAYSFRNMPIPRQIQNTLRDSLTKLIPVAGSFLVPVIKNIDNYIRKSVDTQGSLKNKIKSLFLKIRWLIPAELQLLKRDYLIPAETLETYDRMIQKLISNLNIYYHNYYKLPNNATNRKKGKAEIGSAIYSDIEILTLELLYLFFVNDHHRYPIQRLIIEMSSPFLKYKVQRNQNLHILAEEVATDALGATSFISEGASGGSKTRRKYKPKKQKTHSKQKRKYTYHSK